jgi:hypothetical protein
MKSKIKKNFFLFDDDDEKIERERERIKKGISIF